MKHKLKSKASKMAENITLAKSLYVSDYTVLNLYSPKILFKILYPYSTWKMPSMKYCTGERTTMNVVKKKDP